MLTAMCRIDGEHVDFQPLPEHRPVDSANDLPGFSARIRCSVIVAGPQCLVTTVRMPTGWWIIGRSPDRILTGDAARPFLFDVGDRVVFRRIGRAEFVARAGEGR